jgi:hypothetical protein
MIVWGLNSELLWERERERQKQREKESQLEREKKLMLAMEFYKSAYYK